MVGLYWTLCRAFDSIHGQLFFASIHEITTKFDDAKERSRLVIDFTEARIWDVPGVDAIDGLVAKLNQKLVDFEVISLDASSICLLDSLSVPYAK